MNERLKEIALECTPPYSNFDHTKFADMIVQECIDTMNKASFNGVRTTFDAELAGHVKEVISKDLKALFNGV